MILPGLGHLRRQDAPAAWHLRILLDCRRGLYFSPSINAPGRLMMNTPRFRRPLTRNTTRTPRQVPRGRSKPPLCDTGPVPPTPARMKLLALVLALSVNSRPSSLNCAISSPGFRRLPRWRIMATRHSRGALTRSAHDFENCHYKNPYHGQGALDLSWCVGSGQG